MFDPKHLIDTVGLLGIFAIIFAESGLLVGFFLPGDSLLFTAGFFASHPASVPHSLHLSLAPLLVGVWIAAIAGDQLGYWFGRRVGPTLFARPDSRFFKQENLHRAEEFFERNGSRTIVYARFIPIVRTFTPIVAGTSKMPYRTYLTYDVAGGTLWSIGITLLGYFLGHVHVIAHHIELAVLVLVAISLTPVAVELLKHRRERQAGTQP